METLATYILFRKKFNVYNNLSKETKNKKRFYIKSVFEFRNLYFRGK